MNIQQLEYLIAVDKYRHFGKAAQACFITQPTLSAMIQRLEEEIGVKIFDRAAHPIRTTDAGAEIISEAKKIIDSVNMLRNKADLLSNTLGGKLNLGIIPTVSISLMPAAILRFLKINENIGITVKEMTTDNIIKSLKSGELDAGIISTPYAAAAEFSADHLYNEELMVYSAEAPAGNKFVSPEDVDPEKIWLLEEGNCLRRQFENICSLKENSTLPKNLNFRPATIDAAIQMADSSGGITLVPELAAELLGKERRKKIARFVRPYPYREISIIYYKPTYKQRIIKALSEFIMKELQPSLSFGKNPEDYLGIAPQ